MPWFYAKNKQQIGPVEDHEFDALVASGTILPTDLVWQPNQPEWLPLAKVRPAAAAPPTDAPPPVPPSASPPPTAAPAIGAVPSPVQPASAAAAPAPAAPKGVGGWLLLFCLGLTIFGPIWRLYEWSKVLPYLLNASFSLQLTVSFAVSLLLTIASIVVGFLIWTGRPDGRKIAQTYLLARLGVFGVMFAFNFLQLALGRGLEVSSITVFLFRGVLPELAFFVVWWFYFQNSKRVKATYGE